MQIYKTKEGAQSSQHDYIFNLVKNDLGLDQKINQLISSYQQLKLDPIGFRNLIELICNELGIEPRFPRKGDVNERFDVLLNTESYQAVCEIEIPSTAILDAPRNILDDIAVQINRHGADPEMLIPLVLCWDLPNNRTDYWNVITDVNRILDIKIKTCTILGLAVLAWTGKKLELSSNDYYLNSDNNSQDNIIKILKDNGLNPEKYAGILFPVK